MARPIAPPTMGSVSFIHSRRHCARPMLRSIARRRAYPTLAWTYVAVLALQFVTAGMYVFVGAGNVELHRNVAHLIGLVQASLLATAIAGRIPEVRAILIVLGLLVLQGMLVHVGQWFGLWIISAFHPLNAVVLSWAAFALARRSTAYWHEPGADRLPANGAAAMAA